MTVFSTPCKLSGYELYRTLGSPTTVVAPMVDQSELAWRALSRRYNAQLAYTPMINAKVFIQPKLKQTAKDGMYDLTHAEEGSSTDRPLVAQFCAHDPAALLAAAREIAHTVDAIDINLGCPQEIARKGRYGAFLMDDWPLIHDLIRTLHDNLDVPVTAKFRVFETVEKTVAYAQMLEQAGAQILTVHGRLRAQRGQNTGLADWTKIRAVKESVSVPVFANGNVLYHADLAACLQATGADGVMSAEGQLYNPAIFAPAHPLAPLSPPPPPETDGYLEDLASLSTGLQPRHAELALEYLALVRRQVTPTASSAVKGHLFKLLRPALAGAPDLRDALGRCQGLLFPLSRAPPPPGPEDADLDIENPWPEESTPCAFASFTSVVRAMRALMETAERTSAAAWAAAVSQPGGRTPDEEGLTPAQRALGAYTDGRTGVRVLPCWVAQPYVHAPKPEKGKAELAAEAESAAKRAAAAAAKAEEEVGEKETVTGSDKKTEMEMETEMEKKAVKEAVETEVERVVKGVKRAGETDAEGVVAREEEGKRVRLGAPGEGDVYG